MTWNWQQKDWPKFRYDARVLQPLEEQFLHQSGILVGTEKHLGDKERYQLIVEVISDEAVKTSEIEGEYLNRDSVQSSIRKNFGLATDNRKIAPAEKGISELLYDLYTTFNKPLTHKHLFAWHSLLLQERTDIKEIGKYRTHKEPMQIISGRIYEPKVHFEAPPSKSVPHEMKTFVDWFNQTGPNGKNPLSALTRSGIAHLYFVCIHPFEDGNGRIGRAIAEKVLSQNLGQPTLVALSHLIQKRKKNYYDALARNNQKNEITDWLHYFATTILEAQSYTQSLVHFLISKTKLYDRIKNQLNPRQAKVIERMLEEGVEGFQGGLSAEKYIRLTKASRATVTRDLQELVDIGALKKTGSLKSTRYHLNI